MADRKAVNRYYPPDFDPTKHGSINKYRNSHPLRERAKRLDEGILVIRFEMPYNIWCGGCGKHIGMGVRYNAEKTKVGNYYTTPIYRFRMKCHLCDHYFEMETNPMECDYTIVTGAHRKNQKWDMAENEQVLTEDRATVKKLAADPMFKLEHGVDDTKKLKAVAPTLHELQQTQTGWKDDFDLNKMLRNKFREEKVELKTAMEKDKALLTKSSLDIALVPEHEDDKKLASLMKYKTVESSDEKQKKKRQEISNRSIFSSKSSDAQSSSSSASSTSSTPQSQESSREHTNSGVKKHHNLIDKLKAAKRTRAGFDDFGSRLDRKTARQGKGIGIVTSKKGKDSAHDGERLPECQNEKNRSDQETRVSQKVGDGSRPESEALKGTVVTDEDFQKVSLVKHDGEPACSLSENIRRSTDGNVERADIYTDGKSVTKSQSRDTHDHSKFSQTANTHQQPNNSENAWSDRKNSTGISEEHVVQAEDSSSREPRVNKYITKSLVSCDYSSSESDE
ncbi:coiled-coil domain-containing protein 130-like [Patiria miniata]|uniref:Coiled-coil domain-containing protein 130 n=1 Tax=Patiria miniata TaxID=46514 RepID=A0A913Z9M8_PATMI|nr:coiled-coil domain-containing protein 130-like [Patiria miniata]